jgi:hypothetical protein
VEPRAAELGDASAVAEGSRPSTWEASLERIERELAALKVIEIDTSWELQLIIARQLRELLLAIRPLTKHPLLRRT